ncbi:MAG: rhodanese-like domain-containing protein [Candidatus Thorarchaeota archaeon]|nr:rhodanese-like domain-containing protein [Candidatus Thorarchaeota archaeon]
MKIETIRSEGLAHLSYLVSSEGESMVLDPRRDCDIYVEHARRESVNILQIFETHRNEDYVVGSLELQNRIPSARIGHSAATSFKYGDDKLEDEDTFKIGKMLVTCVHTPGHTNDSMCYVVSDASIGNDPLVVFTGDTLFVNEVGRTDLVDIKKHEEMSRKLFHSLQEKILPLGDGVIIHPGHGAGSVCGGAIGSRDFSTIGYECKNNIWLDQSEDDFVQAKLKQHLTLAPYFKRCEKLNTDGPPLLSDIDPLKVIDVSILEDLMQDEENIVVDTRLAGQFVDGHIPRSISLDFKHMGLFAGWVLFPSNSFILLLTSPTDIDEAAGMLYRVGLDTVIGHLNGGFESWKAAGKSIDSLPIFKLEDIKSQLSYGTLEVIDVRQPHEAENDYIENSIYSPLTTIGEDMTKFPPEKPLVAICPAGFRSTTGASIMKRGGLANAGVSDNGLMEWKKRGYPIKTGSNQ